MLKILVRVPNWLGDSVLSLLFFDTLQKCFPRSIVDIIVKDSSIQKVFLHHLGIHAIHPFSKSRVKGLHGLFRYGKSLREYGPYDIFITLPNSFSSALIGYGTKSRIRAGYKEDGRNLLLTHKFTRKKGIHRAHSYLYLLQELCKSFHKTGSPLYQNIELPPVESVKKVLFHFSKEEQQTSLLVKQKNFRYVVFNVNSEASSRRLPSEKWVGLGNRLLKTLRVKIVFVGIASEQQRVDEVMQAIEPKEHLVDLCGKAPVRELAILLRDADVLVSNDSGPMHLANAVGTPLVTFFGSADPSETGPLNRENAIVIDKWLKCSPCLKNVCRFPTVRCLEQITVDEIYQSVLKVMRDG